MVVKLVNNLYKFIDTNFEILKEKNISNVDFNDDTIFEHLNDTQHQNNKKIE